MIETTLCYIEQNGKYLMLWRNKKQKDPNGGKWIGVGGKLETGETPEQCLLREVREETGLTLTEYTYRGKIIFWLDPWEDEITYLYTATGFEGELITECDEGELRWVSFDEIPELNLWEGDRMFLKELITGTAEIDMELTYKEDRLISSVNKPILKKENVDVLLENQFLRAYDFHYEPKRHYYVSSRHAMENLVAMKRDREFKAMKPDAVGCVVILKCKDREPLLLLLREMRFPTGQFLLGVPAGLIDPEDLSEKDPIFVTAKRELSEETGIEFREGDEIKLINPFLFSSPGITDESNAMVQMTLYRDKMPLPTREGNVGGECIGGFRFYTKQEAEALLKKGTDECGIYYSVYTWIALMTFISGIWS